MTDLSTSRWYVVETHSHAEVKVAAHLRRQGFEIYLPRYRKSRKHARRVDIIPSPLFPRYLFVAIDLASQRWRAVRSTVGVARIVSSGEAPTPIAHKVIYSLKSREDADGFIRLEAATPFARGDKIRILGGAFESCVGIFEASRDSERVEILLNLLGRMVRVLLDAGEFAAA